MVSRRSILYAIVIFILAFLTRYVIFLNVGFPTGDVGQFASFVKEFQLNGGYIPATNVLYYPGSKYIYPPLIFLGISSFNLLIGNLVHIGSSTAIYELFYLAIVVSSLQAIFLAFFLKKFQNRNEFLLSVVVLVFFDVSLYEISWGGYPDITATFFLIIMLYFLDKRGSGEHWFTYATILFVLIAYTHDLTYFFSLLVVACIVIFDLIKRNFRSSFKVLILLLVGGAAGAVWWVPRIQFLIGAATVTISQGTGIFNEVGNTTVIFQAVPFMIPVIFLGLLELFVSIRTRHFEPIDSFSIGLIASASGLFFIFYDPTLTGRMILFSYTMLMIMVLKNLGLIRKSGIFQSLKFIQGKRLVALIVLFMLVMAPVQVLLASNTVSYYSTGNFQYSSSLIQYGETHFKNGTILAPNIGNFISAQDGARVIIYTGFVVGPVQIEERNAGLSIILNSSSAYSLQNIKQYNISYIIIQSSLINTTINGHLITFPTTFYDFRGAFDSYYVYQVRNG